jgi:hypothetical protein
MRARDSIGACILVGFAVALTEACSSSSSENAVADSGACDPVSVYEDAGDALPGDPSCWTFVDRPCAFPAGMQAAPQVVPGLCQLNFNDCAALCGGSSYAQCLAYGASCLEDGGLNASESSPIVACGTCVSSK